METAQIDSAPRTEFAQGSALPFKTTDAILAQCLRIAGIKETDWSPVNLYTEAILRPRFSGSKLWEGAKQAFAQVFKGRVEYHFEHAPELKHLLEAYSDQQDKVNAPGEDTDAAEAIRDIMRRAAGRLEEGETVLDEREALLRILCVSLKLRIQFVNRWKNQIPVLFVPDKGGKTSSTGRRGETIENYPGGKLIPLNASDDLLRKMKLL